MKIRKIIAAMLAAILPLQVFAGHYEDGLELYKGGKPAEALAAFRKAAEQDHVQAYFILGAMYENGDGVAKDYAQALAWYSKAAERGDAAAQSNIGTLYENGQGVTKDLKLAASWYLKAAEAGNTQAQSNLGVMYFKGQGVAPDNLEAYKWLYLAETGGSKEAKQKREYVQGFLLAEQLQQARQRADAWMDAWFAKQQGKAVAAGKAGEKTR